MKLAAAAALAAGIGVAEAPAHASIVSNALTVNALTINALVPDGSTIEDLNGVAVEAVTSARRGWRRPRGRVGGGRPRRLLRAAPPMICAGRGVFALLVVVAALDDRSGAWSALRIHEYGRAGRRRFGLRRREPVPR